MLAVGGVTLVCVLVLLLVLAKTDASHLVKTTVLASCIAFLANAAYAPVMIFLNERYPTAIRSRGTAISWNTGFMVGGLLPTFVTLASPQPSDNPSRLVFFVVASAVVFVGCVVVAPETRGNMEAAGAEGANPGTAGAVDAPRPATSAVR